MKAYLVSGFSSDCEGTNIESQVFTTFSAARIYVEECALSTIGLIQADLGNNIYSDKVEIVYNSVIKQYRTIELNINLDKDCDKNFYKEHCLASAQINPHFYNALDLSDRSLTSFKVLDIKIKEIEL